MWQGVFEQEGEIEMSVHVSVCRNLAFSMQLCRGMVHNRWQGSPDDAREGTN